MKKRTLAAAFGLLMAGSLISHVSIGQNDFAANKPYKIVDLASLYKVEDASSSAPIGNSISLLNTKQFKKFNRNFPDATNAVWFQDGKLTRFYFEEGSAAVRSAMNAAGDVQFTIKYYQAAQLPANVTQEIRSSYRGYKPDQVTEVTVDDRTAFVVVVKGIEDWIQLRYLDGEIIELGRFTY